MKIDDRVEERVRAAFSGVVGKDAEAMQEALRPLDQNESRLAVTYATLVCGYITRHIFDNVLSEDRLRALAADVVTTVREWVDLGSVESVASFLKEASSADPDYSAMTEEDLVGYSFVIGGYLLSRYRPEGMRWFEYLDKIWNEAEAANGS